MIQALHDPNIYVQEGTAEALNRILGPTVLERKAKELLEKYSSDSLMLDGIKEALDAAGVRNPEAWISFHHHNSPHLYSTVDILTPNEERRFKKSQCCSANPSQEYIRVLDKKTKKLIAIHTTNCP